MQLFMATIGDKGLIGMGAIILDGCGQEKHHIELVL